MTSKYKLLSRKAASALLDISVKTVDRMADRGELTRVRISKNTVRFRSDELEHYIDQRQEK